MMIRLIIAMYLYIGTCWSLNMAQGTWKSLWLNILAWPILIPLTMFYYLISGKKGEKSEPTSYL